MFTRAIEFFLICITVLAAPPCAADEGLTQLLFRASGSGGDLSHLDGGVLAWVDEVDPSLPRY